MMAGGAQAMILVFLCVSGGAQAMMATGTGRQAAPGGNDGNDGNDGDKNKKGGWPGKRFLDPGGDGDDDDGDEDEENPTIGMRGTARYCNTCGQLSYVGGAIGCLSTWCQQRYTTWMEWRDSAEVQKHLPPGIVAHKAKRSRGKKRRENRRMP